MSDRVDAVNRPPGRIRFGWPLYRTDWELIPAEVLRSNQWQSSALSHGLRLSIPQQSGVYMMCVRPPNISVVTEPFAGLLEIIYVGKSSNLRNRYSKHLNVPSPKVRAARNTYADSIRFWYLRMEAERISAVESLLISCFGPPANDIPGEVQQLEAGSKSAAQSTKMK